MRSFSFGDMISAFQKLETLGKCQVLKYPVNENDTWELVWNESKARQTGTAKSFVNNTSRSRSNLPRTRSKSDKEEIIMYIISCYDSEYHEKLYLYVSSGTRSTYVWDSEKRNASKLSKERAVQHLSQVMQQKGRGLRGGSFAGSSLAGLEEFKIESV